jgi:plastocyanin
VNRLAPLPLLLVALTLSACGSGSSSGSGGVAGTTSSVGGRHVVVTETEYKLQLSTMHLQPGRTTFVAVNKGHVGHSLEIDGPGVEDERIAGTIMPGSSKRISVTLRKGSYELYCPIDAHKGLGMEVHVGVGGATTSGQTPGGMTTTTGGGNGY